jgi:hypothetical protein
MRPVGAEFDAGRYTGGQTDGHDEANSLFFAILRTRVKIAFSFELKVAARACDAIG